MYRAFISYSHKDEAFARWLLRQIEGWRVPRDLVGRDSAHGKVPATLRPVFRDRDDFSGGASLKQATLTALQASEALVVVCSPNAAASRYVDEEIRLFKMLGRSQRVIAIVAAGDPAHGDCFPPWLRREPDAAGNPAGEAVEPIAADARDAGDGRRRAVAKVIAGLLGVPFDEIMRRAETERRQRVALLAGAGVAAFVFATAFSSYALYQSYQAGVAIEKSVFSIGGLIQSTDRLPREGETAATRREMLREQCDLLDELAGDPAAIGIQEKNICFYERTVVSSENRRPEELLATLCAWRDRLIAEVMPKDRPGYDESVALVRALGRTQDRIAASLQAAARCIETPAAKLDDHLGFLLGKLVSLGTKRPDLEGLRALHDDATWQLVGIREKAADWRSSETLMQSAADLRALQMQDSQAQAVPPAAYDYGIYLRRLSWLKTVHLGDTNGAEQYGRRAVEHWTPLAAGNPARHDVGYQAILALEVHGDALAVHGRRDEAVARLKEAEAKAKQLLARLGDGDAELKLSVEGDLGYISGRLAELAGG